MKNTNKFIISVMLDGQIMYSLGPFASYNDARTFWRGNKEDIVNTLKDEGKVTVEYNEIFESIGDLITNCKWL